MKKTINTLLILLLAGTSPLSVAGEENIPEPFRGDDPNSTLEVAYDDLNALLSSYVTVSGWSTREKAPRPDAGVGTRLNTRINRLTALEGNRFYFKGASEKDLIAEFISDIRASLEMLPAEVPLRLLNKNEQLAYWLNLYNFTLLDEMMKVYPKHNLLRVLDYGDDDSIMAQKLLNVAGVPLSLDDIQFTILKEKYFGNPLIIYGLWQGNIGGPSLRNTAYTGKTVWRKLEDNAGEFINSNRGTYFDGEVSALYERNMPFFDNDQAKLISHLMDYLQGDMFDEYANRDDVEFEMEDWTLAALIGEGRKYGRSAATNGAAMLDAVVATQPGEAFGDTVAIQNYLAEDNAMKTPVNFRFSEAQLEILQKLRTKHEVSMGRVEVTDLDEEEASEDKKQNN